MRGRRLAVACAACAAAGGTALAALPSASAEQCTITVNVLNGAPIVFTVDVPPGTPLSALSVPVSGPVASMSESCPDTAATTAAPTPPAVSNPPVPQGTTSTPASVPQLGGQAKQQKQSGNASKPKTKKSAKPNTAGATTGGVPTLTKPAATPLRGITGIPTALNPTASFALPGPAPLGVPNFFIDSFQIPPFLLPIYQAAGIEYSVPWQVLAAINEVETNYGRNLSISSAGALGWMQFLPSTWKQWGVDANGDGVRDPYNPVDAIFSAARYLDAAGASQNLGKAVFSYNHAVWYVEEVLLRAKLIGGMPSSLVGALTGLVEGHFPVAAPAQYADDNIEALATRRIHSVNAALPIKSDHSKGVNIFAAKGSPLIAVNDGKIVDIGENATLGKYVKLQDQTGNIYTYAHLGSVAAKYAVPKAIHLSAAQIRRQLASTPPPVPPTAAASAGAKPLGVGSEAASAGVQTGALTLGASDTSSKQVSDAAARVARAAARAALLAVTKALPKASTRVAPQLKERLFAHPGRAASFAAGGAQQLQSEQDAISSFRSYFTSTLHLARSQYRLAPLRKGAIVVAGTVLGKVANADPVSGLASHMLFQVQPAGANAPQIDPKPILDGWKLLEATAVYRADGQNPFFGPDAKNASIGQVLLMSKDQLEQKILTDPHVKIYSCGQRDIAAGLVDRRVLAVIEYLAATGLDPTVSGLVCGNSSGASGSSVNISQIDGIPVLGHQGTGSITDMAIRRLLTLQGALAPTELISLMSYKGQENTLALPDHADRLQVAYTPQFGVNKKLTAEIKSALKPTQWIDLIKRIGQIPEPIVPITPSKYAIQTGG